MLMKLILVHLIMHFDLECLKQRPKPSCIGGVIVSPGPVRIGMKGRTHNGEDCNVLSQSDSQS